MAFKNKRQVKERVELVSLIDMIFILLVFFLVTSFVIRLPFQERGLSVPTPENTLGRAQIVVQLLDERTVFWMDESASETVSEIEENFGYLSAARLRNRILNELINRNVMTYERFMVELDMLRDQANTDPNSRFFVLIRCPNEIPYYRVIEIIAKISDTSYRNIKYGCVGGTLREIRDCRRIYTVVETDAQGNRRKNIRIDF